MCYTFWLWFDIWSSCGVIKVLIETAAGWRKESRCLKLLRHPVSPSATALWCFAWGRKAKEESGLAVFIGREAYRCQGNVTGLSLLSFSRRTSGGTGGLFHGDRSITVPWQGPSGCVFWWLAATDMLESVLCLLPHGQPGQPADGRPSPSTPSAPSCWTPSRRPFLSPPSPAAPSAARWSAPGRRDGGGGWRLEG